MLRRFVLLMALMFWQGGFMFYGAVVVEVGSRVLGSHLDQGLVTRSVTNYVNAAGAVALAIWAWEIAGARDPARGRGRLRWGLWLLLVIALGILTWQHVRLDELIDAESPRILDQALFHQRHRWYLAVSTLQWAGSVVLTAVTLLAWRGEDQGHARGKTAAAC